MDKLYDLNKIISNKEKLYAHIDEDNKKKAELLTEHLDRTIYFYNKLVERKGIRDIIYNIISHIKFDDNNLPKDVINFIYELFINAIYLHDIGKINPAFQYIKMKNKVNAFKNNPKATNSNHSELSALIYIHLYLEKIEEIYEREIEGLRGFLRHILYCFAYIISRHHTYLKGLKNSENKDFKDSIKSLLERIIKEDSYVAYYKKLDELKELDISILESEVNRFDDGHENSSYEFYILNKFLYSVLVSCDYYATHYYDTGNDIEFNYIDDIDKILKTYQSTNIYKGIEMYKKNEDYFNDSPINKLRSQMFIESEDNLLRKYEDGTTNLERYNIFYLEAPTGSGKTNMSINLALNIIKNSKNINKINYIFPFNTLVEQTKRNLDDIFGEDEKFKIAVINSITPIISSSEKLEDDNIDNKTYKEDFLNRQMLHYPVVLTTHINFFNYLFGTGREINIPLVQLCNSVVIIDEIQSYKNRLWPNIIKFLDIYSRLLNIKIIIMSATLPKLDKLIENDDSLFCSLIKNPSKYYRDKIFRERVKLNFDLLKYSNKDKELVKVKLLEKMDKVINENKESRILIEFITKKTAREFYNEIKNKYPSKRVIEITGDDSNYYRKKIIDQIKEKHKETKGDNIEGEYVRKDLIVVATQVIEAGIDIDMDIGFKDISILDAEEQFLGRINRSCERNNCKAYFFNYDKAELIYKKDFRIEKDLTDEEYQKYLISKDFNEFYNLSMKRLKEKNKDSSEYNLKHMREDAYVLNFENISKNMKLIDEEAYQLYLSHEMIIEENDQEVILDGEKIWNGYVELYKNKEMDYSERMIKLSRLSEKVQLFTYNYVDYTNKYDRKPKKHDDRIGNLFYVSNGDEFMIKDEETKSKKFNREKYNEGVSGLFL
ncbi:CRISPR-associated helicase Cas3/CRISPR-associated endonuclease Cas3-HD [Gottschalkia purinilytica]|uniref:CRISPR-associated helicase Cas3/CRISPR-associated endonuclease Cas3-HD n=1 Tax=Gottschalkia purinilytica TaxID=1503 RepID=A0A0L0W9K6_GOTPU|nr:CRISPR-associated helicase/endonuclease Cas3 [Gottschalkia purinilytica]KNF08224.1 CRISPR-associated helicase Cas3/CRISPR-associated endonuclease Cas3-HD [Gottschalkia purinilytica]